MVFFSPAFVAIAASFFAGSTFAHPGHDIQAEIAERAEYRARAQYTNLDHCAEKLQARSASMIARRKTEVEKLRLKRGIVKRSFADVLATDHHSNQTVTPCSPDELIFGSNSSCILQPETTEGPYWVSGELVRKNITDGNAGVPLTFDVQMININTCEPFNQVALEAWHCNTTGVYGGVIAGSNGNTADASNINNTMFRGIQFSNENGIMQFDTTFPGHYTGRTTHIHILAHVNSTLNPMNGTLLGGHVSHVGQLFFDQSLINEVEAVAPYTTNTQELLLNADDGIFEGESANTDPVFNYVYLGDAVEDGLFGWATVGFDPTAVTTPRAAAYVDESGGHANAGGIGGGPGGPRPTGRPPGFPSGVPFPTGSGVAMPTGSA
ncbi:extracellular dioxygenase-like protein [Dothidotthia symphoricarpi CBS 119687]|uniref:Extracellular dioxygenase-like protein n=1 Tax=Dothidotthia symphoricarpi CBS 119687 TaxID=1392245 RepID=A0A6A6APK4_9PLEO|nr:extracellular dioxygenase-like protein [Dothidotthia symphoricarpi CBS 119687]KAF2133078.1 extracellular dioxygenase-like protein [Dothidotthia symphoricarpi CBS 119687]